MKYTYLKLLAVLYAPPVLFMGLFLWGNIDWLRLLFLTFVLLVYGIAWDIWSTKHGRADKLWVWRFNKKTITDVKIQQHPLEEYVFGVGHLLWVILFWESIQFVISRPTLWTIAALVLVAGWVLSVTIAFHDYEVT